MLKTQPRYQARCSSGLWRLSSGWLGGISSNFCSLAFFGLGFNFLVAGSSCEGTCFAACAAFDDDACHQLGHRMQIWTLKRASTQIMFWTCRPQASAQAPGSLPRLPYPPFLSAHTSHRCLLAGPRRGHLQARAWALCF